MLPLAAPRAIHRESFDASRLSVFIRAANSLANLRELASGSGSDAASDDGH